MMRWRRIMGTRSRWMARSPRARAESLLARRPFGLPNSCPRFEARGRLADGAGDCIWDSFLILLVLDGMARASRRCERGADPGSDRVDGASDRQNNWIHFDGMSACFHDSSFLFVPNWLSQDMLSVAHSSHFRRVKCTDRYCCIILLAHVRFFVKLKINFSFRKKSYKRTLSPTRT